MIAGHNRIASISGCIAAAVASALHGGAALAADTSASSGLQEIIVTAQRVQTDLQKTPVSITTFSGEALQERGINSMLEIGAFTPNLQVGSRGGAAGTSGGFAIRGIGVDSPVSSPAVGLYIDDVYFPSSTGNLLGVFDVARVEVLRGPQGTLFGRNTIAGAIQYITVKPSTAGVSGFVEGTGGNFNREDFSGALNAPLSDTVAVRLSLASKERDGFVHDDLNNIDRGSDDTKQGRLQVRWTPTDSLTIDVKGEVLKQKMNGRAFTVVGISPNSTLVKIATGQPLPFPPPPVIIETRPYDSSLISTGQYQLAGLNDPDFFKFEYEAAQGTIAYKLTDNVTLTSISAYSESETDSGADTDGVPISIISGLNSNQTRLFTEELRLSGSSFGDRLNWTTGFYYYDEVRHTDAGTFKIANGSAIPIPGVFGQPQRGGAISDLTSKAYALYAQGTYDLTDRLSGTLGVRYSSEDIDFKELPPYLSAVPLSASDTFTDTSPYVGLNFQVNPDLMIYAKASKGFRAGGNQVVSQFPAPEILVPFEQETAWTYELGTRMEFMNKRLRINPTLFYTDWTDIQFNALSPIGIPYTYNAGDAEIKGAELEMQFAATDRWLLDASVSYLDGEYTRISPAILASGGLTLDDDMQQSPKHKYTAGVRYALPVSNGGRIVTNANYAWVDTLRSTVLRGTYTDLPSYSVVNAQVQYVAPNDSWSVAVFGTNLTDEYYLIGGINFSDGPGALERDPARPREYGVTLRVNF